jgi:hypothetical protein
LGVDGVSDFNGLHPRQHEGEVEFYAFDLIEHDGDDLRGVALIERKQRLGRLLGKAGDAIQWATSLTMAQSFSSTPAAASDRCSLWRRAVEGLAEIQEPGERGCAARARGGVATPFVTFGAICVIMCS